MVTGALPIFSISNCGGMMSSTVRIAWSKEFDNEYKWNEVCAWAVEMFGLPGERFQTHPCINYMDFVFTSNKDALIMALMWNGQIVSDNELAVETVSKFLQ
jgi:hypothetical protein